MPYLNVRICVPASPELAAKVAATLTDLTAEILRKKRELAAVTIEYVPASQWFIGGDSLARNAERAFFLDVKVTEGTNTKEEKSAYVSRVFEAMEALLGRVAPVSYAVVHDVGGDAWGYAGRTQASRAGS